MRLILFAEEKDEGVEGFLQHMASNWDGLGCRRFYTVQDLVKALKEPIAVRMIVILIINNIENLWLLDSQKGLFRANPVLVLLSDSNEESLTLSHRLGARYVGSWPTDSMTLAQIVLKIFNKSKNDSKEQREAEKASSRCLPLK